MQQNDARTSFTTSAPAPPRRRRTVFEFRFLDQSHRPFRVR